MYNYCGSVKQTKISRICLCRIDHLFISDLILKVAYQLLQELLPLQHINAKTMILAFNLHIINLLLICKKNEKKKTVIVGEISDNCPGKGFYIMCNNLYMFTKYKMHKIKKLSIANEMFWILELLGEYGIFLFFILFLES